MRQFYLPARLRMTQVQLAWLLLVLMTLAYLIIVSFAVVLRYVTFKATAFDLGNMDQVLWNTLHGHFFVWTNQGDNWFGPPIRLAQHVEPIILPLSLMYAFHADPRILLILQTCVLASGSLPVFLLTRKHMPDWPLLAALMAGAYLISPALLGLNAFDFHPVALATPLLLYALLALTCQRYVWFIVACIFAGACKEEMPAVIAFLGVLVIWKYKLPRLGIGMIVGGLLWSALAIAIIEPHFYQGTQHNTFWYRYAALGSTPGTAAINVLFHPWLLVITFVTFDRVYYLANLFRSTGFLVLLAPEWLLPTLPNLAINLLSGDSFLYSGVYHYNAAIIPFIMMAAIVGMQRLYKIWGIWRGEPLGFTTLAVKQASLHGNEHTQDIPLQSKVALAYHALTHMAVVTRSVAVLQPRFSFVAQGGSYQWQRFSERMVPLAKSTSWVVLQWTLCGWVIVMCGFNYFIMTPKLEIFWATHLPGIHEARIEQVLANIPADASVSAGTSLNPHLSERQYITVFPNITISSLPGNNKVVDYVVVDLSQVFPQDKMSSIDELNQLREGQFCTVKLSDDVVLLGRRGVVQCP